MKLVGHLYSFQLFFYSSIYLDLVFAVDIFKCKNGKVFWNSIELLVKKAKTESNHLFLATERENTTTITGKKPDCLPYSTKILCSYEKALRNF